MIVVGNFSMIELTLKSIIEATTWVTLSTIKFCIQVPPWARITDSKYYLL